MKRLILTFAFLVAVSMSIQAQVIDLSGDWKFRMDPGAVGQAEKWFASCDFDEIVSLPGSIMVTISSTAKTVSILEAGRLNSCSDLI